MELAASIYQGGKLFPASEADYSTSRELGLVCPFCKESIFLVKAHLRRGQPIKAAWRHYQTTAKTAYCENRALSREGKVELKALQKEAHNQRLKLFNRRFWEIFKYKKHLPPNLRGTCVRVLGEDRLERMIVHCHERWHVDQILKALPSKLEARFGNPEVEEAIRNHPNVAKADPEIVDELVQDFAKTKFSVLRYKILCEVVEWLATNSAMDSFSKLVPLAFIDCIECLPPPIHSQSVAEMILVFLALTDWEEALDSLESKTKAIGFG
jgi:hypothetical protein